MEHYFNWVTTAAAALGGGIGYLLGGWDEGIQCLLILIAIDWVSGVTAAIYNKELCSDKGFRGILRTCAILTAVCLSAVLSDFTNESIRDMVVLFFVANTGISIVENLGKIIELPPKLKNTLAALRGDNHG